MIQALPELKMVSAQTWDEKVATQTRCPHLEAFKKADSRRWVRTLSSLDGVYTMETTFKFIDALNTAVFSDPLKVIADKSARLVKSALSTKSPRGKIVEVVTPWAIGMLAANGEPGAVVSFAREIAGGSFTPGKHFDATLLELVYKTSNHIDIAKPGVLLDAREGVCECVDNSYLVEHFGLVLGGPMDIDVFAAIADYVYRSKIGIPGAGKKSAMELAAKIAPLLASRGLRLPLEAVADLIKSPGDPELYKGIIAANYSGKLQWRG